MDTIDTKLLHSIFEKSDYTYTELADEIGISRNTVSNIMFGHTTPSHFVTTSLAETLELSSNEIIAIFFPNIKNKDTHGTAS